MIERKGDIPDPDFDQIVGPSTDPEPEAPADPDTGTD